MNGIIVVAFGSDYQVLAAISISHARKVTNIPFCVAINTPPCSQLKELKNVTWVEFMSKKQRENRGAKTRPNIWTPFDRTLMLDADTIIQKSQIEDVFKLLDENDMVMYRGSGLYWEHGNKILRLYKKTMKYARVELPISIFDGGLVAWKKNETTTNVLEKWHTIWKGMGSNRDMPALNCAIKIVNPKVAVLPKGFLADYKDENAVIQHYYGSEFLKKYGIPKYKLVKQHTEKDDFNWVKWED